MLDMSGVNPEENPEKYPEESLEENPEENPGENPEESSGVSDEASVEVRRGEKVACAGAIVFSIDFSASRSILLYKSEIVCLFQ